MTAALATLLPNGRQVFLDANGVPLVNGKVYMYIPNTSVFKNTWQDAQEMTLNTNPITLDSLGSALIYGSGQYRQLVKDSLGNTIWDQLTDGTIPGQTYLNVQTVFGAVGDGVADDTAAIQSGLDYLNSTGGCLYFPTGKYRITSALSETFTYSTVNSITRPSIKGDGPGNSQILWDGANSPNTFMMTLQRTESSDGQGLHAHSVIEGIGFLPINSGKNQYVSGLKLVKWAFIHLRDVWCHRLNYGLWLDQVLSSEFNSLNMRVNNYGIWSIGSPSSSLSGVYPNNANTFTSCILGGNLLGGMSYIDGNFTFVGGTIEGNGMSGTTGSGFGVKINNTSTSGSIACNFDGAYFEANGTSGDPGANASTADLWIIHSDASNNLNYSVNNCEFNRVASTYAPYCIYIDRTVSTGCVLNIVGNNFQDYGGYSPSSSRPYVYIFNDGVAATGVIVNDAGNYYNQATELPAFTPEKGVAYYFGAGYRPGAVVYPSVQQSIPNGTTTPITFSTALYNFYSIWNAGDPTKLTVPVNASYVRISGNIRFAATSVDGADFILLLQKNGSATFNGNPRVSLQSGPTSAIYEMQVTSPILSVSAGDYFTLCVSQGTGGSLNTDSVFTSQWFSMEIIG